MNKVAWLKIPTDFFEKPTVKRMISEKNGDKAVLLLILLNIYAGETNDKGLVYLTEKIPYETKDFASSLGQTVNAVKNSLELLTKYGEIEIYEDGKILVTAFSEEQNIDALDKYKEQNRNRMRKWREKKKNQLKESDVTVTNCHCIEVEKEVEIDAKEEIKQEEKDISSKPLYFRVINYLNFLTDKNFDPENENYKTLIKGWESKGYGMSDFKRVIRNKHYVWKNEDKTRAWLRPQTLFGDKFETYLNENPMGHDSSFTVDLMYNLQEEIFDF
ncbi:MAG: hypothetical protein E7564_02365 [Ruminococcaceae bacterium]|nr:hypothetical protein [Oscillospiraceae bacterium]